MPVSARPLYLAFALATGLAIAACDNAKDRGERHYQRGLELVESGEIDRAMIEFRNVLRLDEGHASARLDYARLLRDRGDAGGAIGQYMALVDRDRDSLEGHRELAELALTARDFETAIASVGRAFALAPDDPAVRALKATLDYREGTDRPAALEMAQSVLAETPGNVPAHMVLIADRMNDEDPTGALAQADAALSAAPADEGLHLVRLAALERLGDDIAIGAQIRRMAELFPENAGVSQALVQWHLHADDPAAAEAVLRSLAARNPAAAGSALTVVQFLYETQGAAIARAELNRLIAAAADPLPYQRTRAGLDFTEGDREAAIVALRALTEEAEPSDQTREMQAELAAMLEATGNATGRDALIATVLAADPRHVGALKLRARARIAADAPDLAIADMRTALAEAPRDPEIMTIMAMAHEREGSRELTGERLSLAVEASSRAPAESLRYARFLMQNKRLGPAEGVIADALRKSPDNPDLLLALGQIHLARRDWTRAEQVAGLLRQGDAAAAEMAAGLEMASLAGQNRTEESLGVLRDLAGTGENAESMARLIQGYVAQGDFAAAQSYLDGVRAADPEGVPGRMMQAGLDAVRGETVAAEKLYRDLIAKRPALPQPHRGLFALLASQGKTAEAEAALAAGLAATGGDADLMFLQAGLLEGRGDFEGAIEVYEAIYARDSANPLLANNLASLLTTHRSDPESLDRAFAIARRLRATAVPYFQDTYGWILHRRGDSKQAIEFLEQSAAALGDNALVQYHLGEAQFALGRLPEARASLQRAVDLAADSDAAALSQIAAAQARIVEIDAAPAPAATDG